MRRSAFTLIELLAVIMLLTVLMAVAFPAFRGLERTSKRQQAIAEADTLAQAAMAYRRIYGQWPLCEGDVQEWEGKTAFLIGRESELAETPLVELSRVAEALRGGTVNDNPRGITFLEWSETGIDSDGTPLDPWGRAYVLLLSNTGRSGSSYDVAHQEGGIGVVVTDKNDQKVTIDTAETAAAFSWGDPAMSRGEERILGSWSKR